MDHASKDNGKIIDNILGPLYGLMVPNTLVISVALCLKAKGHSKLMMKWSLGLGKTANLREKERGG